MRRFAWTILFIVVLVHIIPVIQAQEKSLVTTKEVKFEAVVQQISLEKTIQVHGRNQLYQRLRLLATSGPHKGQVVTLEVGDVLQTIDRHYRLGDKVIVSQATLPDKKEYFYIVDYIRRDALYLLFALFVLLSVAIGRKKGLMSLVGLALSFFIIFKFVLPQILQGQNPILIAVLASLAIVPVTFYLSHGVNRKTTSAVAGTVVSLIITGVIAVFFVQKAQLTGLSSEEVIFLAAGTSPLGSFRDLLLAGIIIGTLGILDDITVTQASIVTELRDSSPNLTTRELYGKAMSVGRDHIASMVNTLILVYTGAAMPLLLLFMQSTTTFSEVINYEMIAEEVVRTLVSSIGLILAVPITTFIACLYTKK